MPQTEYRQDFSAGDFSTAGYASDVFISTLVGGSDTPITGYPKIGRMERVFRNEGAGPGGLDAIDARTVDGDPFDFEVAWFTEFGIGTKANGNYDVRDLFCRIENVEFRSGVISDGGVMTPLILSHGFADGQTPNLGSGGIFFKLTALRDSGTNFTWYAEYARVNGSVFTATPVTGSADVADDASHTILCEFHPSTVTGAYAGDGTKGSASVASDGSFTVTVDGVTVVSASGLQWAINWYATTNPAVYDGHSYWIGD